MEYLFIFTFGVFIAGLIIISYQALNHKRPK